MKRILKKGLSVILSVCIMISLVGIMPIATLKVQAASYLPSITAFASKTELMNRFDLDGTNDTVGRIYYGANAQEWYVVGTDVAMEEDNIVLFAATPLVEQQAFYFFEDSSLKTKEYNIDSGCIYEEEPLEVYVNHYGTSNLRNILQEMTDNSSTYFSQAENELMNETDVITPDLNSGSDYVTKDKLYALKGDCSNNTQICAGSDDSLVIDKQYWGANYFWLRSPSNGTENNAIDAIVAGNYGEVYGDWVNYDHNAIQPAFNLNLSKVLFASAVPVDLADNTSGEISNDTAMKLRMDGKSEIAAKAVISGNTIEVVPTQEETVTLVIQGNDGTKDWYRTKQISFTDELVTNQTDWSEIENLSDCKIWIEKIGNDGLVYAKNALVSIESVDIADIAQPTAGNLLDTSAICETLGVKSVAEVVWTPEADTAGYNTVYTVRMILVPQEGYEFASDIVATVNENAATSVTLNEDGTLTVTYTYEATQMDVTAVPTVDVTAGTYTENQWVTLSTQTEGAGIYYTLDGTEPSVTNGSKYTEAISVTGERGQSRTTTIKAIAVKDGMQDSSVVTLEYIINIPNPKLLSITAPTAITGVANGTAKTAQDLGLPERVSIVTEDESVTSAIVTWDLKELANGSYDPLVQTEQTFTVNGAVTLPEGIDANGIELKVQVTITVDANAESGKDDDGDNDDSGKDDGGDNDDSGIDDGEDNNDDGQDVTDKPWPFTDIPEMPGYWKYDNVKYVYDRSIMNGIAGTTLFDPDGKLNRAMFATVLYRMAGSPKVEFKNTFTDVEDGKYYSDAVMWVNEKGIAQGFQDGSYGVTRNITREQIAKMLCEYAMKQGYDASGRSSLDSFTDKDSVNYWAVDYMQWTVNTGMISGKPNGDGSFRLDPKGDATRAECAKMLTMFLKKYEPNK